MDQPSEGLQWAVHAAYRKGWEVRLTYYERLLRSIMEMLEDAQAMMKVDDLTEELRSVARAVIELEDAWGALSLKRNASLMRASERSPCQRERGRGDGA